MSSVHFAQTSACVNSSGDPITMSALVIGARPADPELVNNEAEDTDPTGLFIDSFEVPEP